MRSLIVSTLMLMALTTAGCGGTTLDCEVMCKKSLECDADQKLADCMSGCATANQVGNGAYLSAIEGCLSKSCNERDECAEAAVLSCDGDPTPLFDDYCDKIHSCDSSIPVDFCKASFTTGEAAQAMTYLKCINDATLSQMSSCVQEASCANFNEDSQKCFENLLDEADSPGSGGT